ncbi:hypothetical protein D3C87_1560060 [compost metagenome]
MRLVPGHLRLNELIGKRFQIEIFHPALALHRGLPDLRQIVPGICGIDWATDPHPGADKIGASRRDPRGQQATPVVANQIDRCANRLQFPSQPIDVFLFCRRESIGHRFSKTRQVRCNHVLPFDL